jgi:hypothetical protein
MRKSRPRRSLTIFNVADFRDRGAFEAGVRAKSSSAQQIAGMGQRQRTLNSMTAAATMATNMDPRTMTRSHLPVEKRMGLLPRPVASSIPVNRAISIARAAQALDSQVFVEAAPHSRSPIPRRLSHFLDLRAAASSSS